MKRFFLSDILYGLLLTVLFAFLYLNGGSFLETLELKSYDLRSKARMNPNPGNEISIIAIDDESLSKLGRWPWPRSRIADLLIALSTENARPAVIGLNILFSEAEQNPGLAELDVLKQKYADLVATRKIKETAKDVAFADELDKAKSRLDNDSKLAAAIAESGNVLLPMYFVAGGQMGGKPLPMPQWAGRFSLPVGGTADEAAMPLEAVQATVPLDVFASSAAGLGHVNIYPDMDGTVRREYAALLYGQDFYPSFAVELTRSFLRLNPGEVIVSPGRSLSIGKTGVPTDQASAMLITFNGPDRTFRYYSFYDVLNGKVAPEAFKNKIVLIGPTAVGVGMLYVTPVSHNFPGVEVVASVVENLLHKRFLLRPQWAFQTEL
ncbi:MAG: CHASE2 domain-containing protein, partial [bacterium]